jgi:hypothetical protein|tara:strand:- start:6646 stop:6924 length:279 start_codon:yes stop_codon:yes gene_type:complete
MKGQDICYNCGVAQEYGTMRDVNENDFDIFCNDCYPSNEIEGKLTHMYEVDRNNCHFTHKDWIKQLALAMTDPKYKEKFLAEHQEYVKAMNA